MCFFVVENTTPVKYLLAAAVAAGVITLDSSAAGLADQRQRFRGGNVSLSAKLTNYTDERAVFVLEALIFGL